MSHAPAAVDIGSTRLQPGTTRLDGESDEAVFVDVRIAGHQDSLFANAGRHYFGDCVILGSVNFVFGAGTAVIENCEIISRDRGSRTNNWYVAAPSTPLSQPYGFVFLRSRLTKDGRAMAPHSVVLGRPWHPGAEEGGEQQRCLRRLLDGRPHRTA